MNDMPLPGPLDEFLANPPVGAPSPDLQRDLLRQTSAMVGQRRRRRRWLVVAASLAAALLIIALGLWPLLRPAPDVGPVPDGSATGPQVVAKAKPGPGPADDHEPKAPPPTDMAPPSPLALEWKAFDASPETQWVLYREAGDRYFEDANDFASALRCYKQAFQRAPVSSLVIDRNDNWMVTALKLDQMERRKEN